MRTTTASVIGALALIVPTAATAGGAPQPPPPALSNLCSANDPGFTVRYPDGWVTNAATVVPECRLFDRTPFTVQPNTEPPAVAVTIDIDAIAYDDAVSAVVNGPAPVTTEVASVVDDRRALLFETISAGALLPEGTRVTGYYVDIGDGRTLRATTSTRSFGDYDENRRILHEMVLTLDLITGVAGPDLPANEELVAHLSMPELSGTVVAGTRDGRPCVTVDVGARGGWTCELPDPGGSAVQLVPFAHRAAVAVVVVPSSVAYVVFDFGDLGRWGALAVDTPWPDGRRVAAFPAFVLPLTAVLYDTSHRELGRLPDGRRP